MGVSHCQVAMETACTGTCLQLYNEGSKGFRLPPRTQSRTIEGQGVELFICLPCLFVYKKGNFITDTMILSSVL